MTTDPTPSDSENLPQGAGDVNLPQDSGDEKLHRLDLLRRWNDAGQGHLPLPSSPEEFEKFSVTTKLTVHDRDPELFRKLAPLTPLPAATELRLGDGIEALLPEDVDPLLAAGYGDVVDQLRTRHLESLQNTFESNHAARMEERRKAEEETQKVAAHLHYTQVTGLPLPRSVLAR